MAHINHIRTLDHISRMNLSDTISYGNNSFAAFCGSNYQRNQLALNTIAKYCGNIGIVLLHNNPQFELLLGNMYSLAPSLADNRSFQMFLANRVNEYGRLDSFYDALYGLSDTEVLDVIAPLPSDNRFVSEVQNLRSILNDYLTIIEIQFNSNRAPFGLFPFNLDLLLDLTKMPYSQLKEQVLNYLPANITSEISSRLSADKAQQKAYNAVLTFSQIMKSSLWTNRGFGNHTKISIISAIQNKQLISIYLPESRQDILDYIYLELQHLNKAQVPYLVVNVGINLNNSPKLKNIFLAEHSTLPYYTGIISEDTSNIISSENADTELAALFSQTQEMYIFACSSVLAAQPFSDGIGSYFRQVTEHHYDLHRQPFHIFSAHGHGDVQREINQRVINPEELVNLGGGCLLYGKNHPIPILVDSFNL